MKIKYAMQKNEAVVSPYDQFPFGCGDLRAFLDIAKEISFIKKIENNLWYIDPDLNYQSPPEGLMEQDIVFYKGDEHYRVPPWHNRCKLLLKQTVTNSFPKNIIHIPFLYVTDFIRLPYVKLSERKIDVLFTGTCWPETNRRFILNYLKSKLKNLNIIFSEYLNTKEYSYLLANSKISLCLDGKWTPECARFSESIQAGCLTFSSDLSYSKLFDNCPYIKINWKDLDQVIEKIHFLLGNISESQEISQQANKFWQDNWHPKKWAELIITKHDSL